MVRKLTSILVLLMAIGLSLPAGAQMAWPSCPPPQHTSWSMTFSDEFTGTSIDRSKWLTSLAGGLRVHGAPLSPPTPNNGGAGKPSELQYYADSSVSVAGGLGILAATRTPQGAMPYTSGVLCTAGKFQQLYGLFEIRCMLPAGVGMWPAFWLKCPHYWPPELDLFEVYGQAPQAVQMTSHWADAAGVHQAASSTCKISSTAANWHTYAIDWEPDSITWYIDGAAKRKYTGAGIPTVALYPIVNLAIRGASPPTASTAFPAAMLIDYVRIWKTVPLDTGPVSRA